MFVFLSEFKKDAKSKWKESKGYVIATTLQKSTHEGGSGRGQRRRRSEGPPLRRLRPIDICTQLKKKAEKELFILFFGLDVSPRIVIPLVDSVLLF